MTRTTTTCIARICPVCRAPNTVIVMATDVRPVWRMNCSRCGSPIGKDGDAAPLPRQGGGRSLPGQAAPVSLPALPQDAGRQESGDGRPRRRRAARRFCTALTLGVGAACGAIATGLLLDTDRNSGVAAPDRYEVTFTAAIGPDSVPAPDAQPGEQPVEHALAPRDRAAPDEQRRAKATVGDDTEHAAAPTAPNELGGARPPAWGDGVGRGGGLAGGAPVMLVGAEPGAGGAAAAPPDSQAAAANEAELALTRRDRREVQRRLRLADHDPRLVDGIFGPATRAAIAAWQESAGLPVTGFLDGRALALLSRQTQDEYRAWRTAERARARERQRTETAHLSSPVPPVSPAGAKCQRHWTGQIAYGQNVRCDFRGLREELISVRDNVVELFRAAESS